MNEGTARKYSWTYVTENAFNYYIEKNATALGAHTAPMCINRYDEDAGAYKNVIDCTETPCYDGDYDCFVADGTGLVVRFVKHNNRGAPSFVPSHLPTPLPTPVPTLEPTSVPTLGPTALPSLEPTALPSLMPTGLPTAVPSLLPTFAPTLEPSSAPSSLPMSPSPPSF